MKDRIDYLTRNRALIIEEYDDNGDVIERREFNRLALFDFIHSITNVGKSLDVARREDLIKFSDEQIVIIENIMDGGYRESTIFGQSMYWFDKEKVEWFENLFKNYSNEEILFALEIIPPMGFMVHLKSKYYNKKITFEEAIHFIRNREGFYYAINNKGNRVYDFVDKPSKQQVRYQRTKNGNKVVFLSFKDWKEYIVSEDKL